VHQIGNQYIDNKLCATILQLQGVAACGLYRPLHQFTDSMEDKASKADSRSAAQEITRSLGLCNLRIHDLTDRQTLPTAT